MVTIDRRPGAGRPPGGRSPGGFTLLELTVVIAIAAVLLSLTVSAFSGYNERTAARRAAQVFARDLALARSMAVRGRESVVIRFYESGRWYEVTTASGRELARRRFGTGGDVFLSAIALDVSGDSILFSSRGIADLSGAALGNATFTAGMVSYGVQFNSMGASRVGQN